MKKVYQTEDGQLFEDSGAANNHEQELLLVWLNESVVGGWIKEVLETMNDKENREYYFTERDCGGVFRDAAYKVYLEKKNEFPASIVDLVSAIFGPEKEEEEEGETDEDWIEIDTGGDRT